MGVSEYLCHLIKLRFSLRVGREEIVQLINTVDDIIRSVRTLRRILKCVLADQLGSRGRLQGYKLYHLNCLLIGFVTL